MRQRRLAEEEEGGQCGKAITGGRWGWGVWACVQVGGWKRDEGVRKGKRGEREKET